MQRTPLYELHTELGGRMVDFAGWEMPIQFEGVVAEHTQCRTAAALFDVSHMAVIEVWGDNPAESLERLTPAGVTSVTPGRQRYGLFTNEAGGVIDDFMVTNWGEHLTIVANASRRDVDLPHLVAGLSDCDVIEKPEVSLIALQGPKAAEVLIRLDPTLADTVFNDARMASIGGIQVSASRAGYTGEDGFEIAVANSDADALARLLLDQPEVGATGLGARDTLRLEAGLCLYGNDLDETISPVEADLRWSIPKRRREAGDFPGAERIMAEWENGPSRVRVGLSAEGKRPIRDGATLATEDGTDAGVVTSGGYGPTVEAPVAMALVPPAVSEIGTRLVANVRGKDVPCVVAALPFAPHRYARGTK
jgi:aminomethyltransferase